MDNQVDPIGFLRDQFSGPAAPKRISNMGKNIRSRIAAIPPTAVNPHHPRESEAGISGSQSQVEASNGNSKSKPRIARRRPSKESKRLADWHFGGIHPSRNRGNHRARSRGPGR